MGKIILSGSIQVPEDEIEKIRVALPDHVSKTLSEEGCLIFEVKESETEAGVFSVYEEFKSKEAFGHHQKRVKESEWATITKNVTRNYQIKESE